MGHGHAHGGEVPEWLPGAPLWRRVVTLARDKVAMATVTLIFVNSLLPWRWQQLRLLGPVAVFVVFGIPAVCETLGHASRLDVHFLMTAAAFASAAIGHAHEGALLLLLFALSEALEERLSLRARASLDALGRLSPEVAHRLPPGSESLGVAEGSADVAVSELRAGDRILVRAGEVVPVDGEVLDGASQVGLQHLTGEPLPQSAVKGGAVMSGALSIDGALLLEVRRPAHESTIQRISRLTADAKATRPRLVTLLDAVAERWSYAVVASTAVIAVVPPLLWQAPVGPSLYRSLVWLITASPCALILAAPMVYVSGLSVAASNGVLLKGGRVLDALATATGVAFDKTGTITTGAPSLERVDVLGLEGAGGNAGEAERQHGLRLASALARLSVHPVSRGLVAAAPVGERPPEVSDFEMLAGAGVSGVLAPSEGPPVRAVLGRPDFVAERLMRLPGGSAAAEAVLAAGGCSSSEADGRAVAAFATCPANGAEEAGGARAWLFHFEHRLKASAPEVLAEVSRGGPVYMLTGDRQANALRAAEQLGDDVVFEAIHADLRPEDKLARVRELDESLRAAAARGASLRGGLLRALGASAGGVIMVGDGVNDGPALAAATAGISLAAQAEGALPTAVEGSDVLVLPRAGDPAGDGDLRRVGWLLGLARKARRIMLQNILLAAVSIGGASALTLCAPLPLWLGVLLHEGTTMLVGLNSLRLFSPPRLSWRAPFQRGPRRGR